MSRAGSVQLQRVLSRGTYDTRWVADVSYDGQRVMQDVPLVDVSQEEDGTSKVQQGGSATIVWTDTFGRSIAPQSMEDVLSPFGTTITLYMIVSNGPVFSERVRIGTYVLTETPSIQTTWWRWQGRALAKGDKIKVSFKDPFYRVLRNRFDLPGVTPSLASVYGEIQRLTQMPVTRNPLVADGSIPRALVYEEDRLDAIYELANVRNATPYVTNDGTVSLRPNSWTNPVGTIRAADAGSAQAHLGTLLSAERSMSAEGVYNRVVARAQGLTTGVLAAAEIRDGVLRAVNPDGSPSPFGRVPYFLSSQFITTPAQAQPAVADLLRRVSRPQATVLDIEELVNPLREVGDVVTVLRAGETYLGRVRSISRSRAKTQKVTVVVADA